VCMRVRVRVRVRVCVFISLCMIHGYYIYNFLACILLCI